MQLAYPWIDQLDIRDEVSYESMEHSLHSAKEEYKVVSVPHYVLARFIDRLNLVISIVHKSNKQVDRASTHKK